MEVRSTQTTLFPEDLLTSFIGGGGGDCSVQKKSDSFVTVVPVNLDPNNCVLHDTTHFNFNSKSNNTNNNNCSSSSSNNQHKQTNGFVTVVQVGGGRSVTEGEEGVEVDIEEEEEVEEVFEDEVTVFRLPGERLGMGLQFDGGGTQQSHFVSRLYIQSVAEESPTDRTSSKWGKLEEGDQILKIDDRDVTQLTRVECVTALRNAPVAVRLLVRHRNRNSTDVDKPAEVTGMTMECCKPPPVPPRRIKVTRVDAPVTPVARKMLRTETSVEIGHMTSTKVPCNVQEDHALKSVQAIQICETACVLGEEEEPVQADVYVDLIAEEDIRSVGGEYESDDTASSASTVIERFGNVELGGPCSVLLTKYQEKCPNVPDMALGCLDAPKQLGSLEELGVLEPPECFQDHCSVDLAAPAPLPVPVPVAVPKPRQRPPVPARIGKKVVKPMECPPKPPRVTAPDSSLQELTSEDHFIDQQHLLPTQQQQQQRSNQSQPTTTTFADSDAAALEPDCAAIGNSDNATGLRYVGGAVGGQKGGVSETTRVATCEVVAVIEKMSVVAGRHDGGGVGRLHPADMPSQSMATVGKGQCNNQLLIDVTEDRYTTDSSTCSRLPPDGHEFPPNYQETLNCSTNNNCSNNSPTNKTTMSLMDMELDIGVDLDDGSVLKPPWGFEDTLNVPPPPTLPPPGKTCEKRNTGKRNDDLKANLSVKDKIAMFASLEDVSIIKQNEPSPPPCFVDVSPFTTTLVISKEKEDTGYSSWDKDRDILGGSSTTSTVIPNVPPAPKAEFQHWRSVTNLMVHNDRPESSLSTSSTLSRSSDDLGNRYTSKMSMYPQTASSSDDNDHDQVGNDKEKKLMQRRSLYSLMESRMQTVSKLRGLVIPDAPRDSKDASASVEHLPTIVTAVQVAVPQKMEYKSTLEMTPNAVSNNNNNNNKEVIPQLPELPPPLPPAPRPAPRTNATFRKNSGGDSIDVDVPSTAPPPPVAPPRVVTGKEGKPALERAVSAPQIDADADESVRILKANSVEAINRMNVLRSAKTSSGARVALVDIAIEDATPQKVTTNTETRQEPAVRVATINVVAHSDSEDEVDEEEEEDMEVEEDEVVASTNVSSTPLTRTEALVTIARKLSVEESLEKKPIQVNESTCNGVEAVPIVPVAVPVAVPKAQVSSEKWSELEQKYGPKAEKREKVDCPNSSVPPPRMPSTLPRNLSGIGNGNGNENGNNKNFRTIADKWQERASTEPSTAATLPRSTWKSEHVPNMLPLVPGRKLSAPPSSAPVPPPVPVPSARGVAMRDNSNKRMSLAPRPASMVENGSDRKLKAWDPNNVTASNGSYLATGRKANTGKATSFGDLRQVFEKQDSVAAVTNFRVRKVDGGEQHVNGSIGSRNNVNHYNNHARMSSLDSTASGDSDAPVHYSSANCLPSAVDHYGSVTSLSSSTSLISSQELQQLIEEANQSLEESGTQCQEVMVVVLQRESMGGSVGVTLAGGADYDSKEITINRIIKGGLAEKDGRIQQGDRVISVNGKHLRGVTHKEALNILKAPRSDCVLVLSRNRTSSVGTDDGGTAKSGDLITASKQKTVDTTTSTTTTVTSNETVAAPVTTMTNGKCEVCLEIVKDGSGLGFTLDGGKQSLLGDKPLTVKKIFSDKGGVLKVGDEILSINDTDATNMARSEAWNFMRKLPDGVVKLVVRQSS